jgi:adenine/guanine phosphoribosyltransferase-like PRPP-binding protein
LQQGLLLGDNVLVLNDVIGGGETGFQIADLAAQASGDVVFRVVDVVRLAFGM